MFARIGTICFRDMYGETGKHGLANTWVRHYTVKETSQTPKSACSDRACPCQAAAAGVHRLTEMLDRQETILGRPQGSPLRCKGNVADVET